MQSETWDKKMASTVPTAPEPGAAVKPWTWNHRDPYEIFLLTADSEYRISDGIYLTVRDG